MKSDSIVIETPADVRVKMTKTISAGVFAIFVTALIAALLPAIYVSQLTGSVAIRDVVWLAGTLLIMSVAWLLFRRWRFRLEISPSGLVIGRHFRVNVCFEEVRKIVISSSLFRGHKGEHFITFHTERRRYCVFVRSGLEDEIAHDLLALCPQAVLIDANGVDHLPPRLADRNAQPGRQVDFERIHSQIELKQRALRHHRILAVAFLSMATMFSPLGVMALVLISNPENSLEEVKAYAYTVIIGLVLPPILFFMWRRSRRRCRIVREEIDRLRRGETELTIAEET